VTVATMPRGLTLDAACVSFALSMRIRLAPETLERMYIPRLMAFVEWAQAEGLPAEVEYITREHVELYIHHLQHTVRNKRSGGLGVKSATVAIAYRCLRRFFNWLVEEDDIPRSPMAKMHHPPVEEHVPEVLTPQEVERLFRTCKGRSFEDRRDTALMRVLLDTGVRRGELVALTVEDVFLEARRLFVAGATSKSRAGRYPRYTPETAVALDRYLRIRRAHPKAGLPALWLGRRGVVTGSGALQIVETRGQQAGIAGLHPHRFRHTMAHFAKMSGVSEASIMAQGGWRDHAMLARYGRSAAMEAAGEEFDRMWGVTG
jgi:site-specific recombinase XerD